MKKLIAIGAILFIVGFVIHTLNWFYTPSTARTSALEANYQNQITRLREIAFDHESRWNNSPEICQADRALFDLPEILYASVEPTAGSHLIVGKKDSDMTPGFSLVSEPFRYPGVVRYWQTELDGSEATAVRFTDSVIDVNEREVFIHLTVNLEKPLSDLEER